jgi:hypothetical protein
MGTITDERVSIPCPPYFLYASCYSFLCVLRFPSLAHTLTRTDNTYYYEWPLWRYCRIVFVCNRLTTCVMMHGFIVQSYRDVKPPLINLLDW